MVLGFWLSYGVALVLLVAVFCCGWAGRRKTHIRFAFIAVAALAVTVVCAEELARVREFPASALATHLIFAKSTAALVLPVLISGVLLSRNPRWRLLHRIVVLLFCLDLLAATATGVWMFSSSAPR